MRDFRATRRPRTHYTLSDMETAPPALRGDGALPSFTEEELSTHDIKRLLRQASERMRAAVSHTPSSGNVQLGEFTKIETTQVLPRYVLSSDPVG